MFPVKLVLTKCLTRSSAPKSRKLFASKTDFPDAETAGHPGIGFGPAKVQSGVSVWRMRRASDDGVVGFESSGRVRKLRTWTSHGYDLGISCRFDIKTLSWSAKFPMYWMVG